MPIFVLLSMVLCTIKYPKSYSIRVGHRPYTVPTLGFLLSQYCHDRAESDVEQHSLTHSTAQHTITTQITL